MSFSGKNKRIGSVILVMILLISGLSAWRAPVIFGFEAVSQAAWLGTWLVTTVGFVLFWAAIVWGAGRLFQKFGSGAEQAPRLLLAILGGVICGLLAFLFTTPAGLTRVTLELDVENVWSPQIFSAAWVTDGLWDIPFTLPEDGSVPVSLEIVVGGKQGQEVSLTPGQAAHVWFVRATWPDGRDIPFEQFQTERGWQQQRFSWGAYQNQPVWVAQTEQPAILRWQGVASGPLTLLFASNPQSGQVTVRWQGVEQRLDLLAPTVGFKAVTLAAQQPAVWRAKLPLSALQAEEIGLNIAADPAGNYSPVFRKLGVRGLSSQTLEFTGSDFLNFLQVKDGHMGVVSPGVQVIPQDPRDPPQLFLPAAKWAEFAPNAASWSRIIPWLENGLLILYLAMLGFIAGSGLASVLPGKTITVFNRLAISLLIILAMAELGPRLVFPPAAKYYPWLPNLQRAFRPDPTIMPGVQGESHFIVNSQGIRGDEFSAGDNYRILAIGGSTTECLYLDQAEAWPHLIQDRLNEQAGGSKVWVGNTGKSARTSREHLLHVQYLIPQYPKIDAVILLVGFNDFNSGFRWGEENPFLAASVGAKEAVLRRAFDVLVEQDPFAPYYQQTAIWRIVERSRRSQSQLTAVEAVDVEDETGQNYVQRREKRQLAPKIDELPDLSAGLAEYEDNLDRIIDLAEIYQVRVIFMTQPTMYRPDLTEAEEKLFWLGAGPGREYFYSSQAMGEGISRYNQRLLEVCRQRQVECLDLASALPKNTTVFYDEVHFNEHGAQLVADVVTDYLLSHPPFSQNQP
ncbi:MAG: hypothetical protein KJ077_32435 [Anaerolineae bacterium]|nr:hypothetical protein [Anaerolineae bacterium]